jgi:hypothetical protein
MNQVRSVLTVAAAALALAACEGAGSITDPTFRDSKAAPRTTAGSGFHADNTGSAGSGYNVAPCTSPDGVCAQASLSSGSAISAAPTRPLSVYDRSHPTKARPAAGTLSDCMLADNTGSAGSGYNYCPQ